MSNTSTTFHHFFHILNKRYGGLKNLFDKGNRAEVITRSDGKLLPQDLHRLFTHEATAIHIRNFYPPIYSKLLGKQLANDALEGKGRNWKVSTSKGLESSDVLTLGEYVPYNVAVAMDEGEEYFEGVLKEFTSRRITSTSCSISDIIINKKN